MLISSHMKNAINEEYIWGDDLFALFRWEKSGAWHWLHESPYFGGQFRFVRVGGTMGEGLAIPYDYVIDKMQTAITNPIDNSCSIISPCLWTPGNKKNEKTLLQTTTEEIIAALVTEKIYLEDINWKQFEDVVALLLMDKGIEIHKVVERPQGGKDLIVRGELIPGEPTYMAVEIKHRKKVGVAQLRSSMKATEAYPALLFVTSGRFTADVITEKRQQNNQLRLILKDGTALESMMKDYAMKRQWLQ